MADSSTDQSSTGLSANTGSANTGSANAVIPVLEGQSCIGELLPDFKDAFGMSSPNWKPTETVETAASQQMLF